MYKKIISRLQNKIFRQNNSLKIQSILWLILQVGLGMSLRLSEKIVRCHFICISLSNSLLIIFSSFIPVHTNATMLFAFPMLSHFKYPSIKMYLQRFVAYFVKMLYGKSTFRVTALYKNYIRFHHQEK